MRKLLTEFLRDEEGATAIEYGLITALIAVPIVAFLPDIGKQLAKSFETILTALGGPVKAS
jgi:pilus assembly protein Flp/PilA